MTERLDEGISYLAAGLHRLAADDAPGRGALAEAIIDVVALLIEKNQDYGSAAFSPPILAPDLPAETGLLCRLSDKIARLIQGRSAQLLVAENYRDTIRDLAGYAILWLALTAEGRE